MKKLKKILALILALVMVFALTACGSSDTSTAEDTSDAGEFEEEESYTVAYAAAATSLTTFTTILEDDIKAGCEANGWEYILMDAEGDSSKQDEQIQSLLLMDIDLLILYATDNAAAVGWCQAMDDAGIPVILFNSSINEEGYKYAEAYVGVDSKQMGTDIGNYLIDRFGADAGLNIAVLDNVPGQYDFILRLENFEAAIADTNYTTFGYDYCFADRAEAQTIMENYITANDDIDVLFGTTDVNTLGAIVAIEDAGLTGEICVMSIDGMIEAFQAVRDGKMDLTIFYSVEGMADDVVAVCEQVLAGEEISFDHYVPYYLITKGNVDDYTPEF